MTRIRRDHARLLSALERATAYAEEPASFEARVEDVSSWSVGHHLEHLLLADRGIVEGLEAAAAGEDPGPEATRAGRPSLTGWIVLLTGFIPRGRGNAPDSTVPAGADRANVVAGLREVTGSASRLGACLDAIERSRVRVPHPVLGEFTPAQWLRFAGIHHDHHEKIIRDVLASM